jgi:hypothetical protein
MPTTRRSRTVADVPERVWETASDPYHLPRCATRGLPPCATRGLLDDAPTALEGLHGA